MERVGQQGEILGERLKKRLEDLPCVGDIRGLGFMWGLELVKDKGTLTPFPRQEKAAERVWEALFRQGIITYRSTGLAGIDGDALMVAPPFIIEEKEIDLAVNTIGKVLDEILC